MRVAGDGGDEDVRSCGRTGLRLVRSQEQPVYRVAKHARGSMNPRVPSADEDPLRRGRWDVVAHRTAYAATKRVAAYGESLGSYRRRLDGSGLGARQLSDFFSALSATEDVTVDEQVAREWEERNYVPPGVVTQGWRIDRTLYKLRLPGDGWFVDVDAAESLKAISDALEPELASLGVDHLTLANLRAEDRNVTTAIATWLYSVQLDSGDVPKGIRYESKLGSDWECWAVWLRSTDANMPHLEELREESGEAILPHDQDLQSALNILGLKKTW